jgi:hypothetical protein
MHELAEEKRRLTHAPSGKHAAAVMTELQDIFVNKRQGYDKTVVRWTPFAIFVPTPYHVNVSVIRRQLFNYLLKHSCKSLEEIHIVTAELRWE